MNLKEIRMPDGFKDVDEAVRGGAALPEPIPVEAQLPEYLTTKEALVDFDQFVLMESSEDMEQKMLGDVFVLGRMAIMGQFTVFYGGPNAGKTLIGMKLITEAVRSAQIDGSNVYYINADDTYKGVVTKKRLSEEYGFKMLVPGMEGFKAEMLVEVLRNRAVSDTARGCIVILDTLKKFTDLMSKNASSAFGDVQRAFISAGGTIIGYAHVNKAKNEDGESVHAGTTDIIDDGDCAYILDVVEDDGDMRTVRFRNIKDRGDVAQVVNYQYKSKGNNASIPYLELFHSVTEVDAATAIKAHERAEVAERLAANHDHIQAILHAIDRGEASKTGLTAVLTEQGVARAKAVKLLMQHTGTDKRKGHRWNIVKGEKNAQYFIAI